MSGRSKGLRISGKCKNYIYRPSTHISCCGIISLETDKSARILNFRLTEHDENRALLREIEFELKDMLMKKGYILDNKIKYYRKNGNGD